MDNIGSKHHGHVDSIFETCALNIDQILHLEITDLRSSKDVKIEPVC